MLDVRAGRWVRGRAQSSRGSYGLEFIQGTERGGNQRERRAHGTTVRNVYDILGEPEVVYDVHGVGGVVVLPAADNLVDAEIAAISHNTAANSTLQDWPLPVVNAEGKRTSSTPAIVVLGCSDQPSPATTQGEKPTEHTLLLKHTGSNHTPPIADALPCWGNCVLPYSGCNPVLPCCGECSVLPYCDIGGEPISVLPYCDVGQEAISVLETTAKSGCQRVAGTSRTRCLCDPIDPPTTQSYNKEVCPRLASTGAHELRSSNRMNEEACPSLASTGASELRLSNRITEGVCPSLAPAGASELRSLNRNNEGW